MRSRPRPTAPIDADVVVIGAGVSGITCAAELVADGHRVIVVEGRDRIGGRVLSVPTTRPGPVTEPGPGSGVTAESDAHAHADAHANAETGADAQPAACDGPIELGAQVVHGAPDPFWEALDVVPGPPHSPEVPRVRIRGRTQPLWSIGRTDPPWLVEAAIWQGSEPPAVSTLADLVTGRGGDAGTAATALEWLGQSWAGDPSDLSVREARRSRSPATPGGPLTVAGGIGPAVARMAAGLDIRTSWPVRGVEAGGGDADVIVRSDQHVLRATAAVLTVPPTTMPSLQMPSMPAAQRRAAAGLANGDAFCLAVRRDAVNDADELLFDADGLLGFVRGLAGSPWLSVVAKGPGADRLRQLMDGPSALQRELASALGGTASVIDVVVADWGRDPFSLGAFSIPVPDAAELSRRWRQPVAGRIAIAGEACADGGGRSFLQSAHASGRRAAAEVVGMLAAAGHPAAAHTESSSVPGEDSARQDRTPA